MANTEGSKALAPYADIVVDRKNAMLTQAKKGREIEGEEKKSRWKLEKGGVKK